MTKDEIYSVFDGGDPETALMKLAVSFPRFSCRDLEDVLRALAASEDEYSLRFSGNLSIYSRSMYAFRTIFFIMFKTTAWDDEIVFQPDFLPFVRNMKENARMAYADTRGSRWKGDIYEAFAEMEDRLVEKIRNAPEGTTCLG